MVNRHVAPMTVRSIKSYRTTGPDLRYFPLGLVMLFVKEGVHLSRGANVVVGGNEGGIVK